jgi:malonate-semialdehyde dehydrogenase (acetylating) / methylmalonate-semialdehyde dehydrogenase
MKELTHFVGGKHATGTSGRFCDGFEPMTRYVQLLKPPLPPSLLGRYKIRSAAPAS